MPVTTYGAPDPAFAKELEIVVDYQGTGTLAGSGSTATFGAQETSLPVSAPATPGGTNGSIASGEHLELIAEEYWAPFTPGQAISATAMEDLRARDLLIDNNPTTKYWYESGRADMNISPPAEQNHDRAGRLTVIGGGLLEAAAILAQGRLPGEDDADVMGRALLAAAVHRASQFVILRETAGATNVTGPRQTRWWGHRYTDDEINARFAGMVLGGRVRVKDPWANNGKGLAVEFDVPEVPVTPANWQKLVGGTAQGETGIYPFARWAINSNPTTGQKDEYDFTYQAAVSSNVPSYDSYENLDFNFAATAGGTQQTVPNVLVILGWGVRALVRSADTNGTDLTASGNIPNLGSQYVRIVGNQPHEVHPNNGLPATATDNPNLFGWTYPLQPATPVAYRAPIRQQPRIMIGRRRGIVAMQDAGSGVAVPAFTAGAFVRGVIFENVSFVSVTG